MKQMIHKLKKFTSSIEKHNIADYFSSKNNYELESLDYEIDTTIIENEIKKTFRFDNDILINKRNNVAKLDGFFAPLFHKVLCHIPKNLLLDRSVQQYLSLEIFHEYIWNRWISDDFGKYPISNKDKIEAIENNKINLDRLIGAQAFKSSITRHGIARLYFPCEILIEVDKEYELVKKIFEDQDIFTQIFERQFNLNSEIAKKCIELFCKKDENNKNIFKRKEIRNELKKINYYGSTMSLDHLEDNIENLLNINK